MADTIPSIPTPNVKHIKMFFELNGGRKVEMAEMKALSTEERAELGQLCAEALRKLELL
jgi:hypothetical protein